MGFSEHIEPNSRFYSMELGCGEIGDAMVLVGSTTYCVSRSLDIGFFRCKVVLNTLSCDVLAFVKFT